MPPTTSITIDPARMGVILTGGHSQRMGTPKHQLVLPNGKTVLNHLLNLLEPYCESLATVGRVAPEGVRTTKAYTHLLDRESEIGPIAGFERILSSKRAQQYLILSCDQPLLNPQVMAALIGTESNHTPRFCCLPDQTQLDPFPGVWSEAQYPAVAAAIQTASYGLRSVIRSLGPTWVEISNPEATDWFLNMNTPEDWAKVFRSGC